MTNRRFPLPPFVHGGSAKRGRRITWLEAADRLDGAKLHPDFFNDAYRLFPGGTTFVPGFKAKKGQRAK